MLRNVKIYFVRNKKQLFYERALDMRCVCVWQCVCVCEVSAVGKISNCQPGGPGFNPRPGRGLNFRCPSFATPSVDRDVKPLVYSL